MASANRIEPGLRLPDVRFQLKTDDGVVDVDPDDLCADGSTVVIVGVPGAFTPTCTEKHLPGFVEAEPAFKAAGVDTIACVSVNDAFVMSAWGESLGATDKVVMLADGNGDFATADLTAKGLGKRSVRYAMVVVDGIVKDVFVEPGKGLDVSAADKVLASLTKTEGDEAAAAEE